MPRNDESSSFIEFNVTMIVICRIVFLRPFVESWCPVIVVAIAVNGMTGSDMMALGVPSRSKGCLSSRVKSASPRSNGGPGRLLMKDGGS